MPGDLLRESERAAIISLKADASLLAILPKTSIDPVEEAPSWPFVRLDSSQAVLRGRGCSARSEVRFRLHSFAKPRRNTAGAILETAKDYAARINTAVVAALRSKAFEVSGRRYGFEVTSSDLMQDGAEKDAYHGIASILVRAYQG